MFRTCVHPRARAHTHVHTYTCTTSLVYTENKIGKRTHPGGVCWQECEEQQQETNKTFETLFEPHFPAPFLQTVPCCFCFLLHKDDWNMVWSMSAGLWGTTATDKQSKIQYKISTICFNSISGTAPHYLSDLFQPYTPARQLQSASDTRAFVTPHVNTKTFGERSFSSADPSVWNNLPQTLRYWFYLLFQSHPQDAPV